MGGELKAGDSKQGKQPVDEDPGPGAVETQSTAPVHPQPLGDASALPEVQSLHAASSSGQLQPRQPELSSGGVGDQGASSLTSQTPEGVPVPCLGTDAARVEVRLADALAQGAQGAQGVQGTMPDINQGGASRTTDGGVGEARPPESQEHLLWLSQQAAVLWDGARDQTAKSLACAKKTLEPTADKVQEVLGRLLLDKDHKWHVSLTLLGVVGVVILLSAGYAVERGRRRASEGQAAGLKAELATKVGLTLLLQKKLKRCLCF